MTRWNHVLPASLSSFLVAGGLWALGCGDSPTSPDPPSYSVQPVHQWAGGEVEVAASAGMFEVGDVIVAGVDTLAVLQRRTDRITLPLPQHANGPIALSVRRDTEHLGDVVVEAYGYAGMRVYPVRMDDIITELPVPYGVSVVARTREWGSQDRSGSGFAWIYPSSGQHRHFAGTPFLSTLYRIGVDPVDGVLYYELDDAQSDLCGDDWCELVHAARIVGGELVDMGWLNRPCSRWGCDKLAGDIWIAPGSLYTCRVVTRDGEEVCESIEFGIFGSADTNGISRLWSVGVALLRLSGAAFNLATGEFLYWLDSAVSAWAVAVDENRGAFYTFRTVQGDDWERETEIVRVRGTDGSIEAGFPLTLQPCPVEELTAGVCGGYRDLAYDQARDILFVLGSTLEIRDAASFAVVGEIALTALPDDWGYSRLLVDHFTDRVFIVLAQAYDYEGTPVIAVRLPPE